MCSPFILSCKGNSIDNCYILLSKVMFSCEEQFFKADFPPFWKLEVLGEASLGFFL